MAIAIRFFVFTSNHLVENLASSYSAARKFCQSLIVELDSN